GTLITTTSAGYTLELGSDRVDAYVFDDLLDRARQVLPDDPGAAESLLLEAFSLWRGRPLADLSAEPFVEREQARIEQRGLLARRTLVEARMAEGRHAEVITDLEGLVHEQPMEESLVALLMRALHRCGRSADALRVFGVLRRRLSEELGIDPSAELLAVEAEVLRAGEAAVPEPGDVATPSNLPAPLSSFVGRESETADITEHLGRSRLVTLVGVGGVGKTRLAVRAARLLSGQFDDGVRFVDLVPVRDPDVLVDAFGGAVGLPPKSDLSPVDQLTSYLSSQELLLVVDNCEHLLVEVSDLVRRLLQAAPDMRVLATSRQPLGIEGEVARTVHPLDPSTTAVELFGDRATLVRPDFMLADANEAHVRRICERLDGIPLAIELAAARLGAISVGQIEEHLDDRFRLLTSSIGPDERHWTLLATMDWSHDLLGGEERTLLAGLSVFSGGFTLEAATAVGVGSDETDLDVMDRLAGLIAASLVVFDDAEGDPRYSLLETVRQYAADTLTPDEEARVRLRHARHYRSVAAGMDARDLKEHESVMQIGDRELANFRSAMAWSCQHGHAALALDLARQIRSYFSFRGMNREALRWLVVGLEHVGDDSSAGTVLAAADACVEAMNVDDRGVIDRLLPRIEAAAQEAHEPLVKGRLLTVVGTLLMDSDPARGDALLREAAPQLAAVDPSLWLGCLNNRVELSWVLGELAGGEQVLSDLDELEATFGASHPTVIKVRAAVAARAGRWDEAIAVVEGTASSGGVGSREESSLWGHPVDSQHFVALYGEALGATGRHDEAVELLTTVYMEDWDYHERRRDLVLAGVELSRNRAAEALRWLDHAGASFAVAEWGVPSQVGFAALRGAAAQQMGDSALAARLFGFAEARARELSLQLTSSERPIVAEARDACLAVLGQGRFDELLREGASSRRGIAVGI
ncbi:MAG: ATP-binding protein, partial [Acidimicrobiales bacterium]